MRCKTIVETIVLLAGVLSNNCCNNCVACPRRIIKHLSNNCRNNCFACPCFRQLLEELFCTPVFCQTTVATIVLHIRVCQTIAATTVLLTRVLSNICCNNCFARPCFVKHLLQQLFCVPVYCQTIVATIVLVKESSKQSSKQSPWILTPSEMVKPTKPFENIQNFPLEMGNST